MMRTPKALIWDMDGTLLNTLEDIIGSCNEALVAFGLPVQSHERMVSLIGHGARYLCHGASGLDGDELDRFMQEYRRRAMTRDDPQTDVYPGIREILAEARRRGIRLGIYTNKPDFWCTKLAERFFGADAFDEIYGTNAEGILKPDPEPILRMCRKWGIAPSDAVMIGDSPVDHEVAVNAGCQSACVTWGYRSREVLVAAGAENLVDDENALRRMLFA